jgi:hypothetical protein
VAGGVLSKDNKCQTSYIVDRICVKMALRQANDGRTDEVVFEGGCYEGNQYAHYTPAKSDVIYKLSNIPIEVRNVNDPYLTWLRFGMQVPEEEEDKTYLITYSYMLLYLALFLMLISLVSLTSSKFASSNPEKRALVSPKRGGSVQSTRGEENQGELVSVKMDPKKKIKVYQFSL